MPKITKRTKKRQYRTKHGDAQVGSIEEKYNIDLGVRSDMKLSTYLKEKGYPSLSSLLKD